MLIWIQHQVSPLHDRSVRVLTSHTLACLAAESNISAAAWYGELLPAIAHVAINPLHIDTGP